MGEENRDDPFDDPLYLRRLSRRLRQAIQMISDPELRKDLAVLSLQLAQRAEYIARLDGASRALLQEEVNSSMPSDEMAAGDGQTAGARLRRSGTGAQRT